MSADRAVASALANPHITPFLARPLHVIAVGKAASAMATALSAHPHLPTRSLLAIGTHRSPAMPPAIEWIEAAHPIPDERSVRAGQRALEVASAVAPDECLLLLLSGGASSLMVSPIENVTLAQKQTVVERMLRAGADIQTLNTVRKHLSRVKGGRLAAACRGATVTLAISDVVGDDLSLIGSGPGVADPTTAADAGRALRAAAPELAATPLAETPKPDDEAMARSHAFVVASRRHALDAAQRAAEGLGYRTTVLADDITGEARDAGPTWFSRARALAAEISGPACVLSAGETTVHVTGHGRGGRNQEFVLSLVSAVAEADAGWMVASVGTDGIDGPTDAAGALADETTAARAATLGFDARAFLAHNNAYEYFANLGDLIHLGRTDTNVGDVQVLLNAPTRR